MSKISPNRKVRAVEMFDEVLKREMDNGEIQSLRDRIVSFREYIKNR